MTPLTINDLLKRGRSAGQSLHHSTPESDAADVVTDREEEQNMLPEHEMIGTIPQQSGRVGKRGN